MSGIREPALSRHVDAANGTSGLAPVPDSVQKKKKKNNVCGQANDVHFAVNIGSGAPEDWSFLRQASDVEFVQHLKIQPRPAR